MSDQNVTVMAEPVYVVTSRAGTLLTDDRDQADEWAREQGGTVYVRGDRVDDLGDIRATQIVHGTLLGEMRGRMARIEDYLGRLMGDKEDGRALDGGDPLRRTA